MNQSTLRSRAPEACRLCGGASCEPSSSVGAGMGLSPGHHLPQAATNIPGSLRSTLTTASSRDASAQHVFDPHQLLLPSSPESTYSCRRSLECTLLGANRNVFQSLTWTLTWSSSYRTVSPVHPTTSTSLPLSLLPSLIHPSICYTLAEVPRQPFSVTLIQAS